MARRIFEIWRPIHAVSGKRPATLDRTWPGTPRQLWDREDDKDQFGVAEYRDGSGFMLWCLSTAQGYSALAVVTVLLGLK